MASLHLRTPPDTTGSHQPEREGPSSHIESMDKYSPPYIGQGQVATLSFTISISFEWYPQLPFMWEGKFIWVWATPIYKVKKYGRRVAFRPRNIKTQIELGQLAESVELSQLSWSIGHILIQWVCTIYQLGILRWSPQGIYIQLKRREWEKQPPRELGNRWSCLVYWHCLVYWATDGRSICPSGHQEA